ncbi:DUF3971 domain-containing protein [Martelella limonii]|uniref:YhdP family protein n=1 Tax=Martelella limonii TaxID=1647649 RepID=UPI001580D8B3|nr:DUF3971 domain-containing protein [Martelella limonii]
MGDKKQKETLVRGERTRFGRGESVSLHKMPSAQTHEPTLVRSGRRRSFRRHCLQFLTVFAVIVAGILAIALYVIESGSIDLFLAEKANEQIAAVAPPGYHARVSSAQLRLSGNLDFQLGVAGVDLIGPGEKQIASIGTLDFSVDPMKLIRGQVAVKSVSVDHINFDSSALPSTGTFRLTEHRVDSLPALVEKAFQQTDFARSILEAADTRSIHLTDIVFPVGSASPGKTVDVDIREINLNLLADGILRVDSQISLDGTVASVSAEAMEADGRTESLQAEVTNLAMTPFLLRANRAGVPLMGVDATTDLLLSLRRAGEGSDPKIAAEIDVSAGRFVADSIARPFNDANLNLVYDPQKRSIEMDESSFEFDGSRFPFTAGIIDLDQQQPGVEDGYALDVLVRGGRFESREPGLPPLLFDAQASGEYRGSMARLLLDDISVTSPQGIMAGSFKAVFGDASPELSFGARVERMDTEAVKQLWPFWIAKKPREWVSRNLHGGVITNGDIAMFLPAGRIKGPGIPVQLDETELKVAFDIDDTRITISDKMPDVERSDAHVAIKGGSVNVEIRDGTVSVDKTNSVKLDEGTFAIADTYTKPLMGTVDVMISGTARDVVTLAAEPPFNALRATDFVPEDFSGRAEVNVKATFPLEPDVDLDPDWHVVADITEGAIDKPINNFKIDKLDGLVEIVPSRVAFEGNANADGVPLKVQWSMPITKPGTTLEGEAAQSVLWVSGNLNDAERNQFAPGLDDYVSGPIAVTVEGAEEGNLIAVDLQQATLSLPFIGWQKPPGVAASLSFNLKPGENGLTSLDKLHLSGSGLGASGNVKIDKVGLLSATLTGVALSAGDSLNVGVQRGKDTLAVTLTGRSFSAKPLLDQLVKGGKGGSAGGKGKSGGSDVDVHFDIARVSGENDRELSGVNGDITVRKGTMTNAVLKATTASSQPMTLTVAPDGGQTSVSLQTSGAGALLRFVGIYQKMTGGKLNFDMIETETGWQGMATLADFQLIKDEQLKKILTAPTTGDGKSLNAAYKNQINETDQRFQRAQAVIEISNGVVRVSDAYVRGDQVGATVKGVVRDAAGNIDMTGTFMPAYGLNRIFAEIPLLGPLLGNGNDKGLFGITFRLTGKTEKPELIVNPLSAIAPGVFRRIFEFQ